MSNVKATWELKKYGLDSGHGGERLTNLRFADDLLLIGKSRKQFTKMLEDLSNASRQIGVDVHMEYYYTMVVDARAAPFQAT